MALTMRGTKSCSGLESASRRPAASGAARRRRRHWWPAAWLRQHRHGAADDDLVAQLRRLAGAARTHEGEPRRHFQHHRLDPFEGLFRPAAMIASEPSWAPGPPPETGASIRHAGSGLETLRHFRVSHRVRSRRNRPGWSPCARRGNAVLAEHGPASIAFVSAQAGKDDVGSRSDARGQLFRKPGAHRPPAASALARVRFQTVSSYPALSRGGATWGMPIRPVPRIRPVGLGPAQRCAFLRPLCIAGMGHGTLVGPDRRSRPISPEARPCGLSRAPARALRRVFDLVFGDIERDGRGVGVDGGVCVAFLDQPQAARRWQSPARHSRCTCRALRRKSGPSVRTRDFSPIWGWP